MILNNCHYFDFGAFPLSLQLGHRQQIYCHLNSVWNKKKYRSLLIKTPSLKGKKLIRKSRSPVRADCETIYFFKGNKLSEKSIPYLFEDSESLFGPENLAGNLIEFVDRDELKNFLFSAEFSGLRTEILNITPNENSVLSQELAKPEYADLRDELLKFKPKQLTYIQLEVVESMPSDEIAIVHASCGLDDATVPMAKELLESEFQLKFRATLDEDAGSLFGDAPSKTHVCKLQVSRQMIDERSQKKSLIYRDRYSDRYNDAQLIFLRLSAFFSGTATNY